jgi:hypothetical protein
MTVRELIERLSQFDGSLDVRMFIEQEWPSGWHARDIRNVFMNETEKPVVLLDEDGGG